MFKYLFAILLGVYQAVELLSHMVTMLNLWGTVKLFSQVAAPFYISTSNIWEFPYLHKLANTYCLSFFITVILVGMKRYLIVVSIFIALMANDVENLFIYLLALYMSSLEKCLFKSFALKKWVVFSLLCCKTSFYDLALGPYQIHDLQIFSLLLWVVFLLFWWCPLMHKRSSLSLFFFFWLLMLLVHI